MVREWFKNFLSTTAITIIIITLIGALTGDDSIKVAVILPSVAANAVIHAGLIAIRKVNSDYYLLEMLVEFGYVLAVILATGYLCGWFETTPVWPTVGITAAVFFAACLINAVHINREIGEINVEIKARKNDLESF